MSRSEKIILAAILGVSALVRLWNVTAYFPHFWDEAKYIMEIEGVIPLFGVNAGSFALLKLGHALIGTAYYPQIVTALAGVLTVLGIFLLGKRILRGQRDSVLLGLLMAAQASVMPYFVLYSRHALATVFALCFFVCALWAYLTKTQCPPVKDQKTRSQYLKKSAIAAGLLAFVPLCSFKFLLPTLVLFVLLEVYIARVRSSVQTEYKAGQNFVLIVLVGGLMFILVPVLVSMFVGYQGWFDRAVALSQFHEKMKTMRLALHFLYPVHLYYLGGPLLMLSALAGAVVTLVRSRSPHVHMTERQSGAIMAVGFAVYLLFFGALSHLQAARLYALTLPFVVFASSVAVMQLRRLFPRYGSYAVAGGAVFLLIAMTARTIDYLSRYSRIPEASDVIMTYLKDDGTILANAQTQFHYSTFHSPNNKGIRYGFGPSRRLTPDNPPIVVIQECVDLATTVASHDRQDALESLDSVRARLNSAMSVSSYADLVFAARETFYSSPYYYLEDVYSWRSYRYIRELMPSRRDSMFVYLARPARSDGPPPSP